MGSRRRGRETRARHVALERARWIAVERWVEDAGGDDAGRSRARRGTPESETDEARIGRVM